MSVWITIGRAPTALLGGNCSGFLTSYSAESNNRRIDLVRSRSGRDDQPSPPSSLLRRDVRKKKTQHCLEPCGPRPFRMLSALNFFVMKIFVQPPTSLDKLIAKMAGTFPALLMSAGIEPNFRRPRPFVDLLNDAVNDKIIPPNRRRERRNSRKGVRKP